MGTSASSKGPRSGISLDPPWLQSDPTNTDNLDRVAPARRFSYARRHLAEYIRTGNRQSLGKAIGHYSKHGMGGAKHIAKRMQLTASSAAQIFGFFQEIRNPIDLSLKAWVAAIKHRELSKYDLADHFVDKVLPLRGTLDEESCRMSMDKALIDLIEDNPNIDLFQLSDVDIWRVVTSFVRYEANERLNLDIGKKFEELSITPMEIVERQSEMSDYLMAELDAQIIRERNTENNQAGMRIDQMITRAVENTFMVFEEMLT